MSEIKADALVFFGASGDLAHRSIFPPFKRLPNGTI
jgi:glucose-6-phosphate 1-dehydrogenase